MDEILEKLLEWQGQGRDAALATVVKTEGSTPRQQGAKLLVSSDSELVGSVSGGCVEADVTEHGLQALGEGRPRLVRYGISDDMGLTVGLACGGSIEVLIEPIATGQAPTAARPPAPNPYPLVADLVRQEVPVVVATVLRPDAMLGRRAVLSRGLLQGSLGDSALDAALQEQAPVLIRRGLSTVVKTRTSAGESVETFLDIYPVPPTLYIFGGVHVAIPLTRFAKALGFRVKVIDPRGVFATPERFAEADELVIERPEAYLQRIRLDENSYVVVLTHDPKLDEPVLKRALEADVAYVGAIGSRKTNRDRMERLAAQGLSREKLARVHAPIGLDIGSQQPEEIALAIMAEIVAERYGKAARPMREVNRSW